MSADTHALQPPRYAGAAVARSICPYCGVGCGQLVFHRDNRVVSIEGDPASPISGGHLCPKGAASHELVSHPNRLVAKDPAWRKVASAAALAGSLLTRLGWIAAGRASAKMKTA